MLLSAINIITPYPNEEIEVHFNELEFPLQNIRTGVKFRYFYYDTWDEKVNFKQTAGYTLVSTDTVGNSTSAIFPTNFLNPQDLSPFRWNVESDREYLDLNFSAETSSILIYPSHPFPRITRIDDNTINVEIGVISASGFGMHIPNYEFRKFAAKSNLNSVTFNDSIVSTSFYHAYISSASKNIDLGTNRSAKDTFKVKTLSPNIINNSFRIDVPVVTSSTYFDEYVILSFFNDKSTNDAYSNSVDTSSVLRCLSSEIFEDLGITYPYTSEASLNNVTGALKIEFNDPLKIRPNSNITAFYETSTAPLANSISYILNDTNYYTISVDQVDYPGYPIYLFNYRFADATKDLLTVSFLPSSFVVSSNISSVDVETVMIDNYYQTSYDMPSNDNLVFKRFVETSNDYTLSAIDLITNDVYAMNEWIPANHKIRFINDSTGNKHHVKFQVKTVFNAFYEDRDELNFILNKNKIVSNVSLTNTNTSTSEIKASLLPAPTSEYRIKWDAFPPENIVFKHSNGDILERNTLYPESYRTGTSVYNLGVDRTEIIFYTEEYDVSASTYWYPDDTVFGNVFLELAGEVSDNSRINNGTLSAFFNRNGLSYRVPTDANIIWNETANDSRGEMSFFSNDRLTNLRESTIYGSSNNFSLINTTFSTIPVDENPREILFNITSNVFSQKYNFNSSKMFNIRQYPENAYLRIQAKTNSDSKIYDSLYQNNVIFTNNQTINLSASFDDLTISNEDQLNWYIKDSNNSTILYTGSSLQISLSAVSACATLSALSAIPFGGNFKLYNFIDTMCFYKLSTIAPFEYKAFPEYSYIPGIDELGAIESDYTLFDYDNYTLSNGMSSYKLCHTENFYFSASPGFDKYVWTVGSKVVETTTNKTSFSLEYSDVSANANVYVSAYNTIFKEIDPPTIYNSASSNSSSKYTEPVNFLDFPDLTASILLTNDYFDTDKYADTPKLICEIDNLYFDVKNYNFNIVLSSKDFVQFKNINDDKTYFTKLLKIGIENSDFIIDTNSFNEAVVFLSGDIYYTLNNFDFCTEHRVISSNTIPLTVFNGPSLELYAFKNVLSSNEIVTFYNRSNLNVDNFNNLQFTSFIFDNGEGTIQTTTSAYISASYLTEGAKTPILTGVLSNGVTLVHSWKDLVFVKNEFETYDPNITREFYDSITMPYSFTDIEIKPNEWQYASVVNSSLEKIFTNLSYLSSVCSVNNINFPKAYGGFLGSRFNNFKWDTNLTTNNIEDDYFSNLHSAQIINDKMICLNDKKIELYNISENPQLLFSSNRIGEGEALESPTKIYHDSDINRLFILDAGKQTIFVCDFDISNPTNLQLTHYWGGFGDRLDRTKLNNPVDFCIDNNKNIYIVDKDSFVIKVYNQNLNWIRNIELDLYETNNKPISISESNNTFIITTENSQNFIIDSYGNVIDTISLIDVSRTVINKLHEGILYAISGSRLLKYAINNTFIAEKDYSNEIVDVIFDDFHGYIIFKKYIIKFVDFVEIDKLISADESLSGFSWNEIKIHEHEFVTDYVYNDSFQKIYDNIKLLNSRLEEKLYIDLDEYGDVITQSTSSFSASSISTYPLLLATNEPVLYDTINKGIKFLYKNLEELKNNIEITVNYPNINNELRWLWKYHIVDRIQRPSLNRNPVTWKELKSTKITYSSELSSVSSWCAIRENIAGNHSELCWNYEQTQIESYFPWKWEETECGTKCSHVYTWEQLEKDCCKLPDFVFADCVSAC